jgi:signal transduction histidine kinase
VLLVVLILPDKTSAEVQLSPLAEIHSMPRELAGLEKPVRARGIVTYSHLHSIGDFVIEDEAAGIFVAAPADQSNWRTPAPGALVEVTGTTGAGGYAPVINATSVQILGKAWLPLAQSVTVSQLLTGRFDSRRVEISGVVQHAQLRPQVERFGLELAGEFGRITIFALDDGGVKPHDLIDAEVTVRGVCFPFFNERAQVAGVRIQMNDARDIEIVRRPDSDPFSAPEVTLDKLQPFSLEGMNFHRQRVSGTVTFMAQGDFLYLQEGNHALRVNISHNYPIKTGDRVEAVGFAQVRNRFVEWQRSDIRKTSQGQAPEPVSITVDRALRLIYPADDRTYGDFDGRLVSLVGNLEKVETLKNGNRQLFLDCGGQIVTVVMSVADKSKVLVMPRAGSKVRVSGICIVDYSSNWPALDHVAPVAMHLLSRGPEDVTLLKAASWWSPLRLRIALGASAAILLASFAWMALLHRQVGRRTRELATETRARRDAEVEFDATLRERERVAVDLHDTVEQALTGVSYQLVVSEALHREQPERSLQHLDLAKQLLAQSREEVRRSVWNLRAQALNGRALAEVLRDVCAGLSARNPVRTQVSVIGEEDDLPEFIAGHLLLLAQEAMTNAIKHAAPEQINITLVFTDESVELCVRDDGSGFDPGAAPGLSEGHLGLLGMRERMKRLGGQVTIHSSPGEGTQIRAIAPLAPVA